MTKRLLFIASLPTKKHHLDGERNKSGVVFESLKQMGFSLSVINYSKNKYLQTIKMIFLAMFKKYNAIFISKCAVGGSLALHLLLLFGRKCNKNNIYFYLIGNGFKGFDDKKIYKNDFKKCKRIIVESYIVSNEMKQYDINQCDIFPCVKRIFDLEVVQKKYNNESPIKLIFFSRITKWKGLSDIITAVQEVNKPLTKFTLDIAGGVSSEEREYEKEIIEICNRDPNLLYLGEGFHIVGRESYIQLQKYDLHVFPTRFYQECAPGSIVDMFIAGVPTISSKYENALNMLNDENSYFFEFENVDDLICRLEYIFDHKDELNKKRFASKKEAKKYSIDAFIDFLESFLIIE